MEFESVKPGDVLRDKRSGALRLVVHTTPARPGRKNAYITFRILRPSWTNRMFTVYLWREIAPRLQRFGRMRDPVEIDMYTEDLGHHRPGRRAYDAYGNVWKGPRP